MDKIKTLLIDDENRNLKLTQSLLEKHCENIEIIGLCNDAEEAVIMIQELQPQLIFLDVEMPYLTGFEVLNKIQPFSFEVIFLTAFSQYAIEAFKHHAIGYLTKPIDIDDLKETVKNATKRISEKSFSQNIFALLEHVKQPTTNNEDEKIALATQSGILFAKLSEIVYCESSGNYTTFYFNSDKHILVSRQLGEYEKLLPQSKFVRIHDKYIIQLSYVKEYTKGSGGDVVLETGQTLPVSVRRKDDFLSIFEKWLKRK
jgi:two-component system, LytTR family, response regulator